MSLDPRAIHIYTDGSCYKNPGGRSGCAAVVHYPEHLQREDEQIVDFGCEESSNNRMELLACICALKWVRQNGPWTGVTRVQVFTDSRYVKDNLFRAREWKKNDWKNRHGEPRENPDLWKQLLSAHAKSGITITFEWMLGKKSPILKAVEIFLYQSGLELLSLNSPISFVSCGFRAPQRCTSFFCRTPV